MSGFERLVPVRCSRAGCREMAEWNINWRNPRIHDEDRVKVWTACEAHRDELFDYLDNRGMPAAITPVGIVMERIDSDDDPFTDPAEVRD